MEDIFAQLLGWSFKGNSCELRISSTKIGSFSFVFTGVSFDPSVFGRFGSALVDGRDRVAYISILDFQILPWQSDEVPAGGLEDGAL